MHATEGRWAAASEGRRPSKKEGQRNAVLVPSMKSSVMAGSGATVLVVDDDEQVLCTIANLLESLGCKVITTPDSMTAHAILTRDRSIDLLLTDIMLNGNMGGLELARSAEDTNPDIAIVYSTRYSPMFLLDSEAPCDRRLVRKPCRRGQLEAVLSSVLPVLGGPTVCS